MAVIETNSCPSGMKSTPLFEEMEEEGGYRALLERTFLPMLPEVRLETTFVYVWKIAQFP